MSIAAELGEYI